MTRLVGLERGHGLVLPFPFQRYDTDVIFPFLIWKDEFLRVGSLNLSKESFAWLKCLTKHIAPRYFNQSINQSNIFILQKFWRGA